MPLRGVGCCKINTAVAANYEHCKKYQPLIMIRLNLSTRTELYKKKKIFNYKIVRYSEGSSCDHVLSYQ
jgi:hypothetical protein